MVSTGGADRSDPHDAGSLQAKQSPRMVSGRGDRLEAGHRPASIGDHHALSGTDEVEQ